MRFINASRLLILVLAIGLAGQTCIALGKDHSSENKLNDYIWGGPVQYLQIGVYRDKSVVKIGEQIALFAGTAECWL